MVVFWVVASCSVEDIDQHFRGACDLDGCTNIPDDSLL
jgi:hypothetical protein